jgi:wyosine [tRNA(Phe)-imidazoG37] synthetase (radical SAM superfamily)
LTNPSLRAGLPEIRQKRHLPGDQRKRYAADTLLHFRRAMTLPALERIVYGPIASRRLGRSLGINLLPSGMKVCNMNCAYCQYGWTRGAIRFRGQGNGWPKADAVAAALAARLERAAEAGELIDRITVAGHGEPTLHPDFEEVTARLRAIRDRIAPGVPLAILSNSTTAAWEDVRCGLLRFDERYMKLDAGDPITYSRINGLGSSIVHVIEALAALPSIVIQSIFVADETGEIDNSSDGAVAEWLEALGRVHATGVHIYTLDRAPALGSLHKVPYRRLREIAERVRTLQIPVHVF